jgi:hypothetical protein
MTVRANARLAGLTLLLIKGVAVRSSREGAAWVNA